MTAPAAVSVPPSAHPRPGARLPLGARLPRAAERALARSSFLALAVFVIAGAAVLDDYGVSMDELAQREIGDAVVDYVLGNDDDALRSLAPPSSRFYGAAFEAPLVLVERLLGLQDSRAILLTRHLLTHLLFLTGGLAASLLAYRLSGSRWLALFAMLVFVLHPRLYAHSFFNSKDVPFLVLFMVALAFVHRAFRREGIGAFAVCGAAVGVLINLRVMGVLLFAAVLALRALDLVQASRRTERRRVLASTGGFALAGALTLYALSPALWSNPFELIDAIATFARHPTRTAMLFQGETIRWPEVPAHYLPTWIAITTPPVVLVLSLVGAAASVHHALTRPGEALRNTDARFGLLLAACPVLTFLAVIVLNVNIYDDWRHMYFLYAPIGLLAVLGLGRLLATLRTRPALHAGVRVLAAAGVAATAVEMVLVHPQQASWFNLLVDRRTPENLRTRYHMTYWGVAHREGLEHLLRRFPSAAIPLRGDNHATSSRLILPEADRRRILLIHGTPKTGVFSINDHAYSLRPGGYAPPFAPVVYARKVHHNTLLTVTALDPALVDEATTETYRERYRAAARATPVVRSDFDLHLDATTLTWVKKPCRPEDVHRPSWFFLGVFPVDAGDLPRGRRERGFDNLAFEFPQFGVHVDGACMMRRPLPDYPIRRIETGQRGGGAHYLYDLWRAAVTLSPGEGGVTGADVHREAYRAAVSGAPAARSYFDLYLDGDALTLIREACRPEDLRGRFFVHFLPVDPRVLPARPRPLGFDARDFSFRRGPWRFPRIAGRFDGRCLAYVPLPDHPLAGLRTGQIADGARVWQAELTFPGGLVPASDSDGADPGFRKAGPGFKETSPGPAGVRRDSAGTDPGSDGNGPSSREIDPGSAGVRRDSAGIDPGSAGTGRGSKGADRDFKEIVPSSEGTGP